MKNRIERNVLRRNAVALCATAFAWSACQMPLAFQDPLTASETPAWQTQGRFHAQVPADAYTLPATNPQTQTQPMARQPLRAEAPLDQPADEPLLAWDGGVVAGNRAGSVQEIDGVAAHGLEPSVEGRMHIIELYQEALDERDQLLAEVQALQDALAAAQGALEKAREDALVHQTRITALEEGNRVLMEENHDAAKRLTAAQVRRLEAEKLLLETQIAWHRERRGIGVISTDAAPTQAATPVSTDLGDDGQ